jgi:hypothetical protein
MCKVMIHVCLKGEKEASRVAGGIRVSLQLNRISPVLVLFSLWFSTIQGSLNISLGTGPFLGLHL